MKKTTLTFEQFRAINEGTGNFYNKNASKVFAIGIESGKSDDDDDEEGDDSFDIESDIEYIQDQLKGIGYDIPSGHETPDDDNRSFPGRILGTTAEYEEFDKNEVGVNVCAIMRSGYYQGANLDWSMSYYWGGSDNGDELDESDLKKYYMSEAGMDPDDYEDGEDDVDYKKKVAELGEKVEKMVEDMCKWMESKKDEMIEALEKVYGQCSTKLNVVATFSNGETVYKKHEDDDKVKESLSEAKKADRKWYIGERGNPQLKKPYYRLYGQLSKADVKKKEAPGYGTMYLTGYDTEDAYNDAAEKLRSEGFSVS